MNRSLRLPALFSSELNNFSREVSRIQRNLDRMFNDMWSGSTASLPSLSFPETSFWMSASNYDLTESPTH